jgi:DNA-binding transcriptional LysR family regulator
MIIATLTLMMKKANHRTRITNTIYLSLVMTFVMEFSNTPTMPSTEVNRVKVRRRVVGCYATVLCAAPSVVERLGMPRSLADLTRYDALVYHRDGWTEPWVFPNGAGLLDMIEPHSRIHAADLGIILDAAESGRGIAWLPDWLIEDALAAGRLVRILPDHPARQHPIHLLWATSAVIPARVQVAIEALKGA